MIKYDMLRYKEHFTFVVSYFCIDPKFVRMFMISKPEFQTDNIPVIYYVYLPVGSSPIQSSKPNSVSVVSAYSASAPYKQFHSERKFRRVRQTQWL